MARGESNTAHGASYPSPNSTQVGEGPFYTTQHHHLPVTEDLQIGSSIAHRNLPEVGERNRDEVDRTEPARRLSQSQHLVNTQLASPQQLAQSGLESTPSYDRNSGDPAPRRRAKVSRACDECRRKKIKCDAVSENDGIQCSGCRRSDVPCMFSRTPQKRGPSRGYIKELADRVIALEGRQPIAPMLGYQYSAYNEYSPQPEEVEYRSRRRTQSMSEGLQNPAYIQDPIQESVGRYPLANSEWSNRDIGPNRDIISNRHVPNEHTNYPEMHNSIKPNSEQHITESSTSIPTSTQTLNTHQPVFNSTDDMGNRQVMNDDMGSQWDEVAVDEYYRVIHPTFPILPSSKPQLTAHLDKAVSIVREAFFTALRQLTQVTSADMSLAVGNAIDSKHATELLMSLQANAGSRTLIDNLVYLQALLFMILAVDMDPKAPLQPPFWLNLAASMSTFLKMHTKRNHRSATGTNLTATEMLTRKTWLVLVVLDRWHCASTSEPLVMDEINVHLLQGDDVVLGHPFFHLTRISYTMGNVLDASGMMSHPLGPSLSVRITRMLETSLQLLGESIGAGLNSSPLTHLAYLHTKLLFAWKSAAHNSGEDNVLGLAMNMVALLCDGGYPVSPLIHHFASLAAVTLTKALHALGTSGVASSGLQDLRRWLEKGDRFGWEVILLNYITAQSQPPRGAAGNHGGLRHLADAAVGEAEPAHGEMAAAAATETAVREGGERGLTIAIGYLRMIRQS